MVGAALTNQTPAVREALAKGESPNVGNFFGWQALTLAVMHGNLEMAQSLLDSGAKVNATDAAGSTPLMWAVGLDTPNPALVDALLRHGADPGVKNLAGESALQWATRRGDMALAARLRAAGASDRDSIRSAAASAVAMLQKSGPQFVKASGCVSCHHQSLPQMLNGMARKRGIPVDETIAAQQVKAVVAMYRPIREGLLEGRVNVPNPGVTLSYALLGLHAEGYAPDETTEAMAAALARAQTPDGGFVMLGIRPPMEASRFTAAALSLRALSIFGRDAGSRVAQAREWLIRSKPATTEDKAMRLLGLVWGGAETQDAVAELLAAQRPGGGWAQLDGLEPDAYATGMAIVALDAARVRNPAGVAYLARTRLDDGTWVVRTRANPVQQLRDSGFPHGRDQWISAAATSWAAMALTTALPDEVSALRP